MIVFKNTQRHFSSLSSLLREWRLIESRQVPKPVEYKVGDRKPLYIPDKKPKFPHYPYGESPIFKQSNKGLYGGSFIQFGNNIAESKTKTRRSWLPNVLRKSLWSETLDRKIRIKMTAKVLRTIAKEGGIDNYLTKEKSARIKELGPTGWKLRYRILCEKDKAANPIHQDFELVQDTHGKVVNVFYKITLGDEPLRVTVGKRKLLQYLYPLEKLESKADGIELSYKSFIENKSSLEVKDLVARLKELQFDLTTITV